MYLHPCPCKINYNKRKAKKPSLERCSLDFFQDRAGTPGLRTGRICTLHPESSGPYSGSRAGAFSGGDFSAEQTAGAVVHCALSRSWSLSRGYRLPHYSGRGEARETQPPTSLLKPTFQWNCVCLSTVLVAEARVFSALGFSCPAVASSLPLVSGLFALESRHN